MWRIVIVILIVLGLADVLMLDGRYSAEAAKVGGEIWRSVVR